MKQTLWSISCSTSRISDCSSELQWQKADWRVKDGGRTVAERRDRVLGGGDLGDFFHKAHVWNIQFSTDQQLPSSGWDWIILYGNAIMLGIITCSPGDLVYSSAYCWRWLEHSPESSPENWFLTIHDSPPQVPPLLSDTLANQLKGRAWQLLTSHSI